MSQLINIAQETAFTIQVSYSNITITITYPEREEEIKAKGIMIIPQWIEIIPTKFRTQIIGKEQSGIGTDHIYEELLKGNYYLNIKDYSEQEIKIACNLLINKWTDEIWDGLVGKEQDHTITLRDEIILKHVLEKNNELFKSGEDFQKFCAATKLGLKDFIVPAKFSYLTIKLNEIGLRLQMEQFFARRFLFTESLIQKLKSRVRDYEGNNSLPPDKLKELINWEDDTIESNRIFKGYKDMQQLYDMPRQEIKIENGNNVNIFNSDISDSKINIKNKKVDQEKVDKSAFERRAKIIGLILTGLGTIVTIILNWDSIISRFR